MGKFDVNRTPV